MTLNSQGFDRKADLIFDLVRINYDIAFFQDTLISYDQQIKSCLLLGRDLDFATPPQADKGGFVLFFIPNLRGNVFHGIKIQVARFLVS